MHKNKPDCKTNTFIRFRQNHTVRVQIMEFGRSLIVCYNYYILHLKNNAKQIMVNIIVTMENLFYYFLYIYIMFPVKLSFFFILWKSVRK